MVQDDVPAGGLATMGDPALDRRLRFGRSASAVVLVWSAVSVVLLVTTIHPRAPRGILEGGTDLDAYREGAWHMVAGLPLYDEPLIGNHLYTYPPFSTLTFLPLDQLPEESDKHIWMAANVVLLIVVVAQCWKMLGYRITPYLVCISALLAFACMFLEPVRSTLYYGQINLVLMLLVLWDTSRGEGSRLKGIGVGLAAGIKLTPGYFVLYYLALRQWRAAAVALATIAATVAVGWLVVPDESRQYWTRTVFDSERIGHDLPHPSNQSLHGAIVRVAGAHPSDVNASPPGAHPPTLIWPVAAACIAAVSIWIAVRLYRGGERLLAVTATGLTAAVVSPFSWTHHWVWFVPLMVYTVHRAMTNGWWWLCAASLFVALGSWPYRFPSDTEPRIGLYMFPDKWVPWDVLVNLYIVIYAAVMIGAAVIAVRHAQTSDAGAAGPVG
jgi:alpha-1,2-mannosyltransferase